MMPAPTAVSDELPKTSASAASGTEPVGSDETEVARLEALLSARSAEVRELLAELDRVRSLLRAALGRVSPSTPDAETLGLRGEIAGLRARVDEGEAALQAAAATTPPAAGPDARRAERDALGQARSALERVADAIHDAARPGAGRDDHDTVPGLSLPELISNDGG